MVTCDKSGVCCKLFVINLSEEEYKSGKYKTIFEEFGLVDDFLEAEMCGANLLAQKNDGSCIYLENNQCSIHEFRPAVCRDFFCKSNNPKFKDMIKMINLEKKKLSIPK